MFSCAPVKVVKGAYVFEVGTEPCGDSVPSCGADVLPRPVVHGAEELVFVSIESRCVPGHLLDRDESWVAAGGVGVEDTQLEGKIAFEERIDELVPIVVAVDDRVEPVAERDAHLARAEKVVDLRERQARPRRAVIVDGEVGGDVEAVGVADRGEPRRRTEQAPAMCSSVPAMRDRCAGRPFETSSGAVTADDHRNGTNQNLDVEP